MPWRAPLTRGALLLMEALWTYAVAAFFVAMVAEGGKPSFLAVCAVVFLSYGIARLLQDTDLGLGILRVWGTLLSFLVFYTIVRVDFFGDLRLWDFGWANDIFNHTERTFRDNTTAVFGVPVMWAFWVRGVLRGQDRLGFDDVLRSFAVGIVIVALVEVFEGGIDDSPGLIGKIAVPYAAIGLIAVGLAHSTRAEQQRRQMTKAWIGLLAGVVALMALVALVLALFDLAAASSVVQGVASIAADVLLKVGTYVAWPILQLMEGIFIALRWFLTLILGRPDPPTPQAQTGEPATCLQAQMLRGLTMEQAIKACEETTRQLPDWAKLIVRLIIAAPVVGLVVLMTALMFRRFQRRLRPAELKESTYSEGRLAADLSGLIGGLLHRLRPNIHFGREHLDPMRRLYFDMLAAAEERGIKRSPPQTPLELAPALDRAYGTGTPARITDAFDDVRYGGHAPRDEDARRLRQEWEAVRGP